MHILFIMDPYERLTPETDATTLIMKEAERRGHTIWMATNDEMFIEHGVPSAEIHSVTFKHAKHKEWTVVATRRKRLDQMQAILMRKDPPFTMDYYFSTLILSQVNRKKTFILNEPSALRDFNEKMGISFFKKFAPPFLVSKKKLEIIGFLKVHKKIILKPLDLTSARGIVALDVHDKNRNSLIEILTKDETEFIMVQKYLPEVLHGDKRITILNGKILGSYNRIADPSDHRSNLHAGGALHRYKITDGERKICSEIAKKLKEMGIYFAGLDMIGTFITEINITSPGGGFELMNETASEPLETSIVSFIEQQAHE